MAAGKRILFVLAGVGCGAAGALTWPTPCSSSRTSIFGVQWTAYMIFMVLVGGLGTFEGPIIGAIVFFVIQNEFADGGAGTWSVLGGVAMAFALFLPRGHLGHDRRSASASGCCRSATGCGRTR